MTHPDHVTDAQVLQALRDAYAHGERDDGDAGVPPTEVAEYCPLTARTLRGRLRELARADRIGVRWGFGPAGQPRRSFVPPEATEEDPGSTPRSREWVP